MRHTGNTHTKRGTGRNCGLRLLPVVVFLALLLPVGAGAGVKQDAADPTVRLPAAVFGHGHATAAVNVSLDDQEKDKDGKGDKKCKEKKEDCDPPAEEPQPSTDEDPTASWAGLPIFLPNL